MLDVFKGKITIILFYIRLKKRWPLFIQQSYSNYAKDNIRAKNEEFGVSKWDFKDGNANC